MNVIGYIAVAVLPFFILLAGRGSEHGRWLTALMCTTAVGAGVALAWATSG
jgi:hypothetical protein